MINKNVMLFAMFLGAIGLVSISCDSDSKDSNILEKSIVVKMKSADVINGGDRDIYQYDGDGWRVIATKDTKVYIQRATCDGLNSGSPEQVQIGQTIIFKYDAGSVEYTGNPNTVKARVIEAYRPECLVVPEEEETPEEEVVL